MMRHYGVIDEDRNGLAAVVGLLFGIIAGTWTIVWSEPPGLSAFPAAAVAEAVSVEPGRQA